MANAAAPALRQAPSRGGSVLFTELTAAADAAATDTLGYVKAMHADAVSQWDKETSPWWGLAHETRWWVIHQENSWRAAWDAATALLLLYLAFSVPYTVAFSKHDDFGFAIVQIVWFSIDIVLSFTTQYEKNGVVVSNPKWIALEYIKSYFLIDVVSTFPFDIALENAAASMSSTSKILKFPRLMKTLRVLKMSKMMRFYQTDEVLGQVQINFKIPPAFLSLFKLLFSAMVVNHYFACIWYMLGNAPFDAECADAANDRGTRDCTWLQVAGYAPRDGNWYLYTTCLYWSLMTVSTVGYGDITPHTQAEKLYTIVVMITGVAGYAMLIASMGRLMVGENPDSRRLQVAALREHVYKRDVPQPLSRAIFDYLQMSNHQARYNMDEDEDVVAAIRMLSKPLRRKLTLYTKQKLIGMTPWFDGLDAKFVADACAFMRIEHATPGQAVGVVACRPQGLHFIVAGLFYVRETAAADAPTRRKSISLKQINVDDIDDAVVTERPPIAMFTQGDTLGEPGVFLGATWRLDVVAATQCVMNFLSGEDLRDMLSDPEHAELLPQIEAEAAKVAAKSRILYSVPASTESRRDASRHDDAIDHPDARALAVFLKKHLPEDALRPDSTEPGSARARALVALGDALETHSEDVAFDGGSRSPVLAPNLAADASGVGARAGCR